MTSTPLQSALDVRGALVLDGAMATELERHGADLSGGLWSARLLLDRPELIAQVHRDYFRAGADVAITASYQASMAGFIRAGLAADDARGLMVRSIELAREVRDQFWSAALAREPDLLDRRPRPLVATSVGPYGAVLADGSEYRGHYDISHADLVTFHRERLEVLLEAGVEVLACETIPSLSEAEALLEVIADWPALTAWVSFSARNDREVSDGTAISACSSALHGADQVVAVGVNCTAVAHISGLLHELTSGTDKPLVVYPNSGELYDAEQQSWVGGRSEGDFGDLAGQWYAAGARLIGGCCRTRPSDISAVSAALQGIRAAGGRPGPATG